MPLKIDLTEIKQLSKDEEATVGESDLEVRREDQDKINRFSRLHQKEQILIETLSTKNVSLYSAPSCDIILTPVIEGQRRPGRNFWGTGTS